ncbi:MAG TPA: hypothetical protein VLC06_14045 [Polyangia bacterium]|jgi:hypothetical protein|nr:hypothetical protein [Polyangia bacterium]
MKLFSSLKLLSSLTGAALVGFLLAVFTAQHGCASNCGGNCPITYAYIGDIDNYELANVVTGFAMSGPACPAAGSVGCVGDELNTVCTHFTISASMPGSCDFYVTFSDRPTEVVHLEYGPTQNSNGSCCRGYPVLGAQTYVIPDHASGGLIYPLNGPDGGASNVTVLTDGGIDAEGHTQEAGTTRDAGADSLPADAK